MHCAFEQERRDRQYHRERWRAYLLQGLGFGPGGGVQSPWLVERGCVGRAAVLLLVSTTPRLNHSPLRSAQGPRWATLPCYRVHDAVYLWERVVLL